MSIAAARIAQALRAEYRDRSYFAHSDDYRLGGSAGSGRWDPVLTCSWHCRSPATTLVLLDGAREVRAGVISVERCDPSALHRAVVHADSELAQCSMITSVRRWRPGDPVAAELCGSSPAARPVGTLRGEAVFDAVHYSTEHEKCRHWPASTCESGPGRRCPSFHRSGKST